MKSHAALDRGATQKATSDCGTRPAANVPEKLHGVAYKNLILKAVCNIKGRKWIDIMRIYIYIYAYKFTTSEIDITVKKNVQARIDTDGVVKAKTSSAIG